MSDSTGYVYEPEGFTEAALAQVGAASRLPGMNHARMRHDETISSHVQWRLHYSSAAGSAVVADESSPSADVLHLLLWCERAVR